MPRVAHLVVSAVLKSAMSNTAKDSELVLHFFAHDPRATHPRAPESCRPRQHTTTTPIPTTRDFLLHPYQRSSLRRNSCIGMVNGARHSGSSSEEAFTNTKLGVRGNCVCGRCNRGLELTSRILDRHCHCSVHAKIHARVRSRNGLLASSCPACTF